MKERRLTAICGQRVYDFAVCSKQKIEVFLLLAWRWATRRSHIWLSHLGLHFSVYPVCFGLRPRNLAGYPLLPREQLGMVFLERRIQSQQTCRGLETSLTLTTSLCWNVSALVYASVSLSIVASDRATVARCIFWSICRSGSKRWTREAYSARGFVGTGSKVLSPGSVAMPPSGAVLGLIDLYRSTRGCRSLSPLIRWKWSDTPYDRPIRKSVLDSRTPRRQLL